MSQHKKKRRAQFREAVWSRDGHLCRMCKSPGALDAHHITDRNEMPHGGYVVSNGISLCPACHQKAEVYHASGHASWPEGWHPDDLYRVIGSSYEKACQDSQAQG